MLPGMSGYAVCEAIRNAGNDVPVLILPLAIRVWIGFVGLMLVRINI